MDPLDTSLPMVGCTKSLAPAGRRGVGRLLPDERWRGCGKMSMSNTYRGSGRGGSCSNMIKCIHCGKSCHLAQDYKQAKSGPSKRLCFICKCFVGRVAAQSTKTKASHAAENVPSAPAPSARSYTLTSAFDDEQIVYRHRIPQRRSPQTQQ